MFRLKFILLATCLSWTLVNINTAKANGWFYFDPVKLAIEIRFDGYQSNTTPPNRELIRVDKKRQSLELEERIYVGLSGYAVDPRISNFSIELTPVFRQGRESINSNSDRVSGNDLDYNIDLNFLKGAESAFDLNLNTFRTTSANDLAFGSSNKSDISAYQLHVNWNNPWFPMSLNYISGNYNQKYNRLDGLISRRDEDRDKFYITGNSGKLRVSLDSERVDDKVYDNDYRLSRAFVDHNLRWGKGSNLWSNLRIIDRQDTLAYRQFFWNEQLVIQHTDNLKSLTSYRYTSQKTDAKSIHHNGFFQLRHRLYNNLNSSVRVLGESEQSDMLNRKEFEFGGNSNYQKSFSFGTVSTGLNGYYRLTDRVSEVGAGTVIDEEHEASFVTQIILEERFIDETTIMVSAEDAFLYIEGIDYQVSRLGGVFSELRIMPSGRIKVGDLLVIGYQYLLLPSATYTTKSVGYSLSYAYRWLRLFHSDYRSNHNLSSGFGLPPDRENSVSGVELSWNFFNTNVRFGAQSQYQRIGGQETNNIALRQSLGISLSNLLSINFSGNQVFSENKGVITIDPLVDAKLQTNERTTDFYAFDLGLTWFARLNLTIIPSVGVWKRNEVTKTQTTRRSENLYYNAGLRVNWVLRKLSVNFYYEHNAMDIDGTDVINDRVLLSLGRQFR